jgi:hypothetical protein
VTTDQDVIDLYRCLLGRAPEDAETIKVFRRYYANFDRGRKALFDSKEFQAYYVRVTGRSPLGADNIAQALALAFLARAGAGLPPPAVAGDALVRAGFRALFGRFGKARLALVVGDAAGVSLDDVLPLGRPESAVLQIAPGFPPVVPLVSSLADGTKLFRLGGDLASVAAFLEGHGARLDALYLAGPPGGLDWVTALRPYFAEQAVVILGPARADFDAARISASIDVMHPAEPVQVFSGFHLHHLGGWLLPVTYAPPEFLPALPDRGAYPKLAIAAIMRDEAACIENMLASAAPVASFFAVLDTGSQDDTPALAQAFLTRSGVPFAFAQTQREVFGNSFAEMRNAALAMVPDWVDWVLMLDADEEIVAEDYVPLLQLIASGQHEAYALPRYNFPGADKSGEMVSYPDRQMRLFKHTSDHRIRYEGVVHETIRNTPGGRPPLDASAMGGPRGGPHIHHLVRRFRDAAREDEKQAYYRSIARREG